MQDLAERFSDPHPIILDGAISTELQRLGVPMSADTWSGLAAITHPNVLRDLHTAYLRAGAEVIMANTYAAAPQHVAKAGYGDRAREINLRSAELALEAREAAGGASDGPTDGPTWVAGSLSLMAPGFRRANRQAPLEHADGLRRQAEWLAEAGVDLLVLEMLRDIEWSSAAMDAALSVGLPVWAGFSCIVDDRGTVTTQSASVSEPVPFAEALRAVTGRGEMLVGVMHSEIEETGPGLQCAREVCDAPLGAWPNSGHFEPPYWQFEDLISPQAFADVAEQWAKEGLKVIGGCCGLGPEHVRAVADRLRS
ncbi:MAG: homocysteine S-methyltransferase family protein [Thiotrichales bacterium]|nr:homocysteine S-methyltransferase family protein [Thiotrichales bacterium]MCY4286587.1 homocysteine S-methyltransferase family protein [Thiotrichales bacterium]